MFVIPITVADRVGSLANFRGCSSFRSPLLPRPTLYNGTRKRPPDWMARERKRKAGFAKKGREQPWRRNRRKSEMEDEDGGGEREEDAKGGGRRERGAALRALLDISQVAESPTASTGFGSRNNGKREQRGFTATRRRLHRLVVAAFTDNTESTVYCGALWNYENGTEDGWRRKRKRRQRRRQQRWIASNIGGLNEDRMFASRFVRVSVFPSTGSSLFSRIFAWIAQKRRENTDGG